MSEYGVKRRKTLFVLVERHVPAADAAWRENLHHDTGSDIIQHEHKIAALRRRAAHNECANTARLDSALRNFATRVFGEPARDRTNVKISQF